MPLGHSPDESALLAPAPQWNEADDELSSPKGGIEQQLHILDGDVYDFLCPRPGSSHTLSTLHQTTSREDQHSSSNPANHSRSISGSSRSDTTSNYNKSGSNHHHNVTNRHVYDQYPADRRPSAVSEDEHEDDEFFGPLPSVTATELELMITSLPGSRPATSSRAEAPTVRHKSSWRRTLSIPERVSSRLGRRDDSTSRTSNTERQRRQHRRQESKGPEDEEVDYMKNDEVGTSSRPKTGDRGKDAVRRNTLGVPIATEISVGKRHSRRSRKDSNYSSRSSTPPPIGRTRTAQNRGREGKRRKDYIDYDEDDDEGEDEGNEEEEVESPVVIRHSMRATSMLLPAAHAEGRQLTTRAFIQKSTSSLRTRPPGPPPPAETIFDYQVALRPSPMTVHHAQKGGVGGGGLSAPPRPKSATATAAAAAAAAAATKAHVDAQRSRKHGKTSSPIAPAKLNNSSSDEEDEEDQGHTNQRRRNLRPDAARRRASSYLGATDGGQHPQQRRQRELLSASRLGHAHSAEDLVLPKQTHLLLPESSQRVAAGGTRSLLSASSGGGGAASSRVPDFFNFVTFQAVLRNPPTAHQLLNFSQSRLCGDNLEFLAKVNEYHTTLNQMTTLVSSIHKTFISSRSPSRLLVAPEEELMGPVRDEIRSLAGGVFPAMETLFAGLQARVEEATYASVYPRFVRHQMALSAARALAGDRHAYQGLGDCFCLTDPNKADNPIVFASDGFVKVTGYSRPEIIPRNCRFLQGSDTDRIPIRRLRAGIAEKKETVELILNYKKNGEPFWNLLYVAPLFDERGRIAFFIGGQVNCSTTIHSNADVMRVLSASTSADTEGDFANPPKSSSSQPPKKAGALPSAGKAILKAFGMRVDQTSQQQQQQQQQQEAEANGGLGMEPEVLTRMEGLSLDGQAREFRTAYSRYLVVEADSFAIRFSSESATASLNPANNAAGLVAGQDVFRFLKQNMVSREPSDLRSRIRSAVRAGNAVSAEVRLQTQRSARFRGDERFSTHWTPLKDEKGATRWVVVTLAPIMG
ncbi:hypothetical protein BX600DRAFT_513340 [Xylariales sp. PMI_506]|nr:hypothetical protein BX600DRAFT_513340 [Xylariales sp. PMI_506]